MGKKCWNCKAEVLPKDFFCKFCKKIQENVEIDEFEIFSMDKSVFINLDLLDKKHLELQMTFHPNKFISLSKALDAVFQDMKNDDSQKKVILFSPSAASFDSFKNFEERGKYFNKLITKYL